MAYLFDTGIFSIVTTGGGIGSGWKLGFFTAGTATETDTYQTAALNPVLLNSNPVIADAEGRFPEIWLDEGDYKFILYTDADVTKVTVDDFAVAGDLPTIASALEAFLAASSALPIANGGTASTTAANAIAALGGLPVAGGTMTGDITKSTKGKFHFWDASGMANGGHFITPTADPDPTSLAGQVWYKY